jgi:hypothetical protein
VNLVHLVGFIIKKQVTVFVALLIFSVVFQQRCSFFCAKLPYIGISCKHSTRTIYSDSIFCLALIVEDLQHGPVITKRDSCFSSYFFDGAGEFVEGTAALNQETITQL